LIESREAAVASLVHRADNQLVQAALFDDRHIRTRAARQRQVDALIDEFERHLSALRERRGLAPRLELIAILFSPDTPLPS
jgi:hypothetical protein